MQSILVMLAAQNRILGSWFEEDMTREGKKVGIAPTEGEQTIEIDTQQTDHAEYRRETNEMTFWNEEQNAYG